jgi:hypothetical protein
MGLKPTKGARLLATMASGEKLECRGICHGLRMALQGEPFMMDFFLLPLEGCDAILGTQWLRELGPIWWDFAKLLMNFHWRGRSISLKGVEAPIHRVVDRPEMC